VIPQLQAIRAAIKPQVHWHELAYDVRMPSPDVPEQVAIDVQLLNHPVQFVAFDPFPEHCGGECVFLGRTRADRHPVHGLLWRLSYEAYGSMAVALLTTLAQQAIEQFRCTAVRIHHALGDVPVGQASVLVHVVSGHRGQAFDACRFLIDRLKLEIPIWKREIWADGSTWSRGEQVTAKEPG
jgi:molybdopterin synthase catalytic subunit